ncbi:GNAT family N-acetyltransferase [Stratiformator vulcanicus]|uniref:Acetyltransferase (GNAT) family protein n=1 Tax=Stratiformator vulcanicus TaxID=2527980 RepID=A0A517QZQ9_9PLAN|nr:GNAT family N-acetyltransferase [Stratiformator vulcanicus]QDT37135.1 Acetyltransferase (GNAT) family protein [Stratiformator vulcanicus]
MDDPPAVEIRIATPDDLDILLAGVRALAEYELLSHQVTATEEDYRREFFGAHAVAEGWIAWVAEEPAGIAITYRNFSTFAGRAGVHLEDLYVWPEFRDRGVGFSLVRRVAARAEELGASKLVWQVLDWNAPAIAFYEQLGANFPSQWRECALTAQQITRLSDSPDAS